VFVTARGLTIHTRHRLRAHRTCSLAATPPASAERSTVWRILPGRRTSRSARTLTRRAATYRCSWWSRVR